VAKIILATKAQRHKTNTKFYIIAKNNKEINKLKEVI
jgi:hypothetical protein